MIYLTRKGWMHKHLHVSEFAHHPCTMKVSKFHTKDNIAITLIRMSSGVWSQRDVRQNCCKVTKYF